MGTSFISNATRKLHKHFGGHLKPHDLTTGYALLRLVMLFFDPLIAYLGKSLQAKEDRFAGGTGGGQALGGSEAEMKTMRISR